MTTGASAVSLNPDLVTEARWWEHPRFVDREPLRAAELVASEVLEPALRSRGTVAQGRRTCSWICRLPGRCGRYSCGVPSGQLAMPSLREALGPIEALEKRVAALEEQVRGRPNAAGPVAAAGPGRDEEGR